MHTLEVARRPGHGGCGALTSVVASAARSGSTRPGAGRSGAPRSGARGCETNWSNPWQPLTAEALLERLRVTGRRRPPVDSELAAALRRDLDDRVRRCVGLPAPGPDHLVVTKDRLTRALACPAHRRDPGSGSPAPTLSLACGALVDVLFRQLVTVGAIGDAIPDGLAGLAVDDLQAPLVTWIEQLARPERAELRAEVERQVEELRHRWPVLEPAWLPRTQEPIRTALADGAVELSARVDLAIGRPAEEDASVAIVEVTSGIRRPEHRADLGFAALVETLRSGAPPFVVATYYTRTGELDVEPVTGSLLAGTARRTAAGTVALLAAGAGPPHGAEPLCDRCAALPGEPSALDRPAGVDR